MTGGKKEQAYDRIKEMILENELPPLSDISEEQLQQQLGVSRTPIREAIMKLREDGLVQIYPRKGTIVTDVSMDLIQWTYEIRRLNEPYIVRQACGKLPREWLLKMKRALTEPVEDKDTPERRRAYINYDRELHNTILSTCKNEFLHRMMEKVYDHSHRLRIRTSTANRNYDYTIGEHLDIINALLDDNPDAAEAAALKHVLTALGEAFKYN